MKCTTVYRCPDDISNFKFRIKMKEMDDKANNVLLNGTDLIDNNVEDNCYIANFKWQEKRFGISDIEYYKDETNCVTELDMKYHEDIMKNYVDDVKTNFIYSYVEEDNYDFVEDKIVTSNNVSYLEKELLDRNGTFSNRLSDFNNDNSLMSSICNPVFDNNYECMFIVADFGERYEDTWLKREHVLLKLRYCRIKRVLFCTPDFNKTCFINKNSRTFAYIIENTSETSISNEQLLRENDILNKVRLHNLKLKSNHVDDNNLTQSSPSSKYQMNVHLYVEILDGRLRDCDSSNFYVQYYLDLPNIWKINNDDYDLHGSTQCCHKKKYNFVINDNDDDDPNNIKEGCTVFFGFPFEFNLQCNLQDLDDANMTYPRIYFELISKNNWDRFRIEGTTCGLVPIYRPGKYEMKLNCLRIKPKSLTENLKRYFIGDYMSCNDITWYGLPSLINGNDDKVNVINKYGVDTIYNGTLNVRMNVIHQSKAFVTTDGDRFDDIVRKKFNDNNCRNDDTRSLTLLEKLNASGLIKSVDRVLNAFRLARKRMLEVRERK